MRHRDDEDSYANEPVIGGKQRPHGDMVMNVYNSEGKRSGSCRMNVMRRRFTWNNWRWKQDILRNQNRSSISSPG